jgi:hypothetical protein
MGAMEKIFSSWDEQNKIEYTIYVESCDSANNITGLRVGMFYRPNAHSKHGYVWRI